MERNFRVIEDKNSISNVFDRLNEHQKRALVSSLIQKQLDQDASSVEADMGGNLNDKKKKLFSDILRRVEHNVRLNISIDGTMLIVQLMGSVATFEISLSLLEKFKNDESPSTQPVDEMAKQIALQSSRIVQ